MPELPIRHLLEDIELGRIVLPEVQREFVWSDNDAKDLLDSLYKKYPVGYILLWRPKDTNPFRYLEGQTLLTDFSGSKREPDYYLLDGQQRLTSLLKIKRGEIKVYFNLDTEDFHLENMAIKSDPKWILVSYVWEHDSAKIARELRTKLGISLDEIYDKYVPRIKTLQEVLDRELPAYELREDDYAKITEIYMRLNSKGVRLKKAELFLALAVLNIPNEFRKRLETLHEEFEDWDLDMNFYMRCFTCMATRQSKFEPLREYLKKTPKDESLRILDDLLKYLKITFGLLKTHLSMTGDKAKVILPSEIALIPLLLYIYRKDGNIKNDVEMNKLIYWFLMASFWGRYTGATEAKLDEDLRALEKSIQPIDTWIQHIVKEKRRLYVDLDDLKGKFTKNKLLLLYFLVQRNRSLDWFSATDLKDTDTIELHHIFPKRVLRTMENITDDEINDVRNIAFISTKANRSISSKEPADYFKDIDEERLKSQLIPLDKALHKKEAYHEFLQRRGEMIITSLNNVLKAMYEPHATNTK
jgi:hypothetical protein